MFNNSAQDSTYLAELLATQLFKDAGVPAARVTHARVRLNGRDLGLYVVIEAMNKDFLKRHFGSGKGNLYEGYLQDVHGRLEQDNGDDQTQADLRALNEACTISDPAERWEQLNKVARCRSLPLVHRDGTADDPLGWLRHSLQQLPPLSRSENGQDGLHHSWARLGISPSKCFDRSSAEERGDTRGPDHASRSETLSGADPHLVRRRCSSHR